MASLLAREFSRGEGRHNRIAAGNATTRNGFPQSYPYVTQPRLVPARSSRMSLLRVLLIVTVAASLAGCGVVAFPERVGSATVKMVPVAGHVVAYPLDKTADAID